MNGNVMSGNDALMFSCVRSSLLCRVWEMFRVVSGGVACGRWRLSPRGPNSEGSFFNHYNFSIGI